MRGPWANTLEKQAIHIITKMCILTIMMIILEVLQLQEVIIVMDVSLIN